MAQELTMETRVVRGSRWKAALLCLAFLPSFMLFDPEFRSDQVLRWAIGFFCLCGAVGLAQLLFPARLTLSADGFEYAGMGRRWSVSWRSIETLMLWRNPAPRTRQTLVGWTLRPEARKSGALAQMSRALGIDGAIPGMWTLSPEALLEVMERYHAAVAKPTEMSKS
jgi:hypothetical protein